MKTFKIILFGIGLFFASQMQAQISVDIHFGTPPLWGPVEQPQVRYYYLPDVEAYYDLSSKRFIYFNGYRWVRSAYLPRAYRNYDLYNGYKVVMNDYRGNTPYIYFKEHQKKYYKGYRVGEQKTIGKRPEHHKSKGHDDDDHYKNKGHQKDNDHKH
ncbi:MAG: hypothetical protein COS42_03800 [Flavobacteriales bacterium CG03_land_8_20_14_0_80_35_15]|nr:hypothetical protein [Zetaproteobacteria bacterium]OIO10958.1 MAG: hypothetical protein AUJ53_05840 [Flavobacteriaceae bacterium CG1_02_35_72]PIV17622.1 MAG: hypothetical protein COS42_03800 [Flavobacteriales bacterium CG03_land_8_20_14_0_80_35_15]PIX07271.1 MAG: hypothetical protein COZ76_04305 [Flavobacteriales bacterium CG_4_8_14_3_um_filter_35_10]PJA05228.1 MAG: hypothetical protein COX71_07685 [Flavobacteriales bacterium CG_4_10_14_0_2_um_filter_35_18]